MNRRKFLGNLSAGIAAVALAPVIGKAAPLKPIKEITGNCTITYSKSKGFFLKPLDGGSPLIGDYILAVFPFDWAKGELLSFRVVTEELIGVGYKLFPIHHMLVLSKRQAPMTFKASYVSYKTIYPEGNKLSNRYYKHYTRGIDLHE